MKRISFHLYDNNGKFLTLVDFWAQHKPFGTIDISDNRLVIDSQLVAFGRDVTHIEVS